MESWAPGGEGAIRGAMVRGMVAGLDRVFIDPTVAPVGQKNPGAITYGIAPHASTGRTATAIEADLAALVQAMINGGSTLRFCVWVLHPRSALFLSQLRISGVRTFPDLEAGGGRLLGFEALVSASAPLVGSPGVTTITLIDVERIMIADDKVATVDVSQQASLQTRDDPASGATTQTSLFQANLVAIKILRVVSWQRVADTSVQLLSDVSY